MSRRPVIGILGIGAAAAAVFLRETTDIIRLSASGKDYGAWSLLPALLSISLCFLTRRVIASLFLGVAAAGLVTGKWNIVREFLLPAIGSARYAEILLVYLWCLGGLIGVWTRTGGAYYFADWVACRLVRGPRSAKLLTFLLGLVFHQGGTISTILTGTTARPVADRHRVSHEELSYIVDSTASPVATLLPFNVWPIYTGGLIAGTTPLLADRSVAVAYLFKAIPLNFYSLTAVLFTFLVSLELLPWYGRRLHSALRRARTTGKLDRDGARPLTSEELTAVKIPPGYRPGLEDFALPLGVLLTVAIGPYFVSGTLRIAEAFVLGLVSAIVLALLKGMSLGEVMDGFIDGCKGVTIGALILGLAVTLGQTAEATGAAHFVVRTVGNFLHPVALPTILFLVTMFIAFSTGTSWGTYAVILPIGMPLVYSVSGDPLYNLLCFAAMIGGSVYGDHCSPISDTTILSSLATGTDLMDHVTTQLPLATVAAAISSLAYLVAAAIIL
ncbi:MAG: sodium:proton antiporter [candidate division KSB1 bacterium]|nr:sodium:proton antiporter [candidate division KSB1 bacterium]